MLTAANSGAKDCTAVHGCAEGGLPGGRAVRPCTVVRREGCVEGRLCEGRTVRREGCTAVHGCAESGLCGGKTLRREGCAEGGLRGGRTVRTSASLKRNRWVDILLCVIHIP